jgi:integrase
LGEILHLKWEDVHFDQGLLWLSESKTGRRPVILNTTALTILAELYERRGGESPYVIPGKIEGTPRNDALKRPWIKIRGLAKLEGVRLHDLRHTHGSVGGDAGFTSVMIARLLGHKQVSTAERYVHPGVDPVRRAAETVGGELVAKLEGREGGDVVEFPKSR